MHNKTILITGGAGFIGSHLVGYLLNEYLNYNIINLDNLTYAGDLTRLREFEQNPNYKFVKGNICDSDLVATLFKEHNVEGIFHLAAESHVDNSIINPKIFIETNITGTCTLLEAARKYWSDKALQGRLLHVSTDEVYGSLGPSGYFTENTPYAPNSPYSASKAASDFLVRSYFYTYGLPVIISNCSNNYGPKQHNEKLIPTIIKKALLGEKIPIYGNGQNIRDWLYVEDHCIALDKIFHYGVLGESYNVGTKNEKTNIQMANLVCQILNELKPLNNSSYEDQISYVTDRLGHDYRYAIDNSKICNKLNLHPSFSFLEALKKTVKWYVNYYE